MNEKKTWFIVFGICFFALLIAIFKFSHPDTERAGELQRKLELVTGELERTQAALVRAEQSVGELEELDSRRLAGIERIERSVESIGTGIVNAKSGNERTEVALRGITEITRALEEEFGGSARER